MSQTTAESCDLELGQQQTTDARCGAEVSTIVSTMAGIEQVIVLKLQCIQLYGAVLQCLLFRKLKQGAWCVVDYS